MTDQPNESPAVATTTDSAVPSSPSGRGWRVPVLLALTVVVGGGGALVVWLQRERAALLQAAQADRQALDGRLAALSRGIDTLAGEYRGIAEARLGQEARLAELGDGLSRLYGRIDQSDPDWVLAEVEYLLIAAAQRLRIEGDVGTAIAALEAADGRLRDLGDPALLALREPLAADLGALRAVPTPDLAGLALELAGHVARVESLPLRRVDFAPAAPAAAAPAAEGWRGVAARMWNDLVDLVDVERIAIPDALLTDPEGRRQLTETLRLELSAARLAVLRRDEDNARASAALIRQLLDTYFDGGDAAVVALQAALARIAEASLRPALPALDASLAAVRGLRAGELPAATPAPAAIDPPADEAAAADAAADTPATDATATDATAGGGEATDVASDPPADTAAPSDGAPAPDGPG